MDNINEIITRLERKRIRKEYQHETVFERMKRMFPDRSDAEILELSTTMTTEKKWRTFNGY